MWKWIAIVSAAACLAALVPMAVSANAPNPLARQVSALSRETALLEKQVTALQSQVKSLQQNTAQQVNASFLGQECGFSLLADIIQGTWGDIDGISEAMPGGKPLFGPQVPLNDFNSCAQTEPPVTPARPASHVPGSLASLQSLLNWLNG